MHRLPWNGASAAVLIAAMLFNVDTDSACGARKRAGHAGGKRATRSLSAAGPKHAKGAAAGFANPQLTRGAARHAVPGRTVPGRIVRTVPRAVVPVRAPVVVPGAVTTVVVPETEVVTAEAVPVLTEQAAQSPPLRVINVVDAQTIVVVENGGATNVRLLGVDAVIDENSSGNLHSQAVAYLRQQLHGRQVILGGDLGLSERDESGVRVAYVYRAADGLLMNSDVIAQGYAVAATGYPFELQNAFRSAQRQAAAGKKGVWAAQGLADEGSKKP